ncbi:MAG: CpaF family protein [Chloroflexota bacterium]
MTTNEPGIKSSLSNQEINQFKQYLVNQVSRRLESDPPPPDQRRQAVQQSLDEIYSTTRLNLASDIREKITNDVIAELLGYGPIQSLLDNPDISEIMVNGPDSVYVEQNGKLEKTSVKFHDDNHVKTIIERIVLPLGRHIDYDNPSVDARLPDGSRVNAVIPPVAIDGPSITIRKFRKDLLGIEQLTQYKSLTDTMAEFLRTCVIARLNILISGGTGSGKTTLLNVLSSFIPENERIVTIEDAAELQLRQDHVVRLETKPSDLEGKGMVNIRDLVRNALRMRPDRIVVGEVRGGEAIDMLQAMNTGHDGSLTTLHANSPRDAISRLETMTLMSGLEIPLKVVREQIASAVDLIIQQSRLKDGSRKVTYISEVAGMEGDIVVLTDIFKFEQTEITPEGKIIGDLKPTGIRPLFMPRLEMSGFKLGPEVFGASVADIIGQRYRPPRK